MQSWYWYLFRNGKRRQQGIRMRDAEPVSNQGKGCFLVSLTGTRKWRTLPRVFAWVIFFLVLSIQSWLDDGGGSTLFNFLIIYLSRLTFHPPKKTTQNCLKTCRTWIYTDTRTGIAALEREIEFRLPFLFVLSFFSLSRMPAETEILKSFPPRFPWCNVCVSVSSYCFCLWISSSRWFSIRM